MPMRRCSGESTKNSPPNDQCACPPIDCSPSWSTSVTDFPSRTNSEAATSPANPAPTTMTSLSTAEHLPDGESNILLKGK
ncbi:hypothetical protein GCM10029992_61280 [Glycomyces albus]